MRCHHWDRKMDLSKEIGDKQLAMLLLSGLVLEQWRVHVFVSIGWWRDAIVNALSPLGWIVVIETSWSISAVIARLIVILLWLNTWAGIWRVWIEKLTSLAMMLRCLKLFEITIVTWLTHCRVSRWKWAQNDNGACRWRQPTGTCLGHDSHQDNKQALLESIHLQLQEING